MLSTAAPVTKFKPSIGNTSFKKHRSLHKSHGKMKHRFHLRGPLAAMPCVLCVDDDPDIQTIVEMRMRQYRVQVERAFHGMQGIMEAIRNQPELILLDLAMPNGNGIEVLESLRRNSQVAHIPVVVITGMRDQRLLSRVRASGAHAIINKPIDFELLVDTIGNIIDR